MRDLILPTLILVAVLFVIFSILASARGIEYVTEGFSVAVMLCLSVLVLIQWGAVEVVVAGEEGGWEIVV